MHFELHHIRSYQLIREADEYRLAQQVRRAESAPPPMRVSTCYRLHDACWIGSAGEPKHCLRLSGTPTATCSTQPETPYVRPSPRPAHSRSRHSSGAPETNARSSSPSPQKCGSSGRLTRPGHEGPGAVHAWGPDDIGISSVSVGSVEVWGRPARRRASFMTLALT